MAPEEALRQPSSNTAYLNSYISHLIVNIFLIAVIIAYCYRAASDEKWEQDREDG